MAFNRLQIVKGPDNGSSRTDLCINASLGSDEFNESDSQHSAAKVTYMKMGELRGTYCVKLGLINNDFFRVYSTAFIYKKYVFNACIHTCVCLSTDGTKTYLSMYDFYRSLE